MYRRALLQASAPSLPSCLLVRFLFPREVELAAPAVEPALPVELAALPVELAATPVELAAPHVELDCLPGSARARVYIHICSHYYYYYYYYYVHTKATLGH